MSVKCKNVSFCSVNMGDGFQGVKKKNCVTCPTFVMKALCILRVYCILTHVCVGRMTNLSDRHAVLWWHRIFRLHTRRKVSRLYSKMPCLAAIKWQDLIYDTKIWSFVLYNSITQYTRPHIITYTLCAVYNAFIFLSISCWFSETFLCDWTDGFCITLCKSVVYCKVRLLPLSLWLSLSVIYFICFQIWS